MTENKFIVDAWAWIEYFDGTSTGEQIKKYIENDKNTILTASVTIAEIVSKFLRRRMDPRQAVGGIITLSKTVDIGTEIASFAGEVHAENRMKIKDFGLSDAFVLAIAKTQNAKILTGDPHFKGFKEAILFNK